MTEELTFEEATGLLSAPVKELFQKRLELKKELKKIDKSLKTHETIIKQYMAKKGHKRVEMQGIRIVYNYPKVYHQLARSPAETAKDYPELFTKKIGYERLKISLAKQMADEIKQLENFDAEEQKVGLKILVRQARLKAAKDKDDIFPEDVDEEEYDEFQ